MNRKLIVLLLLSVTIIGSSFLVTKDLVLKYEVRQPNKKSDTIPLLILLHGLGSNEKDLMSFAKNIPGNFLVVAPRAPVTLDEGSYAWFKVAYDGNKAVVDTNEVEKSRTLLVEFIGQLKKKYKFDEKQVYLCGFSQGAIMSYGVGLTEPKLVKAVGALSGRLMPSFRKQVAPQANSVKFFISHGVNDKVIPIREGRVALGFIKKINADVVYKEYAAGHSITPEMLKDFVEWLEAEK